MITLPPPEAFQFVKRTYSPGMRLLWIAVVVLIVASLSNIGSAAGLFDRGTHPHGCAGVPWYARGDVVKKKILARGGITLASESPQELRFSGGTFADEPVLTWEFRLKRGFFQSATVRLVPNAPGKQYRAMCQSIADKYGKKGDSFRFREDQPYGRTTWIFGGSLSGSYKIFCDFTEQGTKVTYEENSRIELGSPSL
ncbi:MAG: hypothetical protein JWQ44_2700 [Chthoniobacter sp.]|nr:hypothetical protein [Chthoniobacter sp.]